MNKENILPKLKKDIRSLLISSKMGLDPEELRRDYISMLGHPIPLKQLGFRNIMDMVVGMPDVVSVMFRSDGSIYLKAVGDETTQNIEELVAKQRVSKADKTRRENRTWYASRSSYSSPCVVLPRRGCAPPAVPAQLRAQLLILLSQGPIRLSDLETCFLRCFGYPLYAQSYGFFSTEEMLRTATDMILIQQNRLGSVVSLRMQPRPASRKTVPIKSVPSRCQNTTSTTPGTDFQIPTKPLDSVRQSCLTVSSPEITLASDQKQLITVSNKSEMVETNSDIRMEDGQLFEKRVLKLEQDLCQQILENGVAGTISQELKDKLRKVVGQTSGGLSVHDVPAEYKRFYGEDLPLLQSGFVSVTELVSAMSDTFTLKPGSGQHWIVTVMQDGDIQSVLNETVSLDEKQPLRSYYFSSAWEGKQKDANDEAPITVEMNQELENSNNFQTCHVLSEISPAIQVHCRPTVPLDAVLSQRLKKPPSLRPREMVQVFVEHVESPGRFYISFCNNGEAQAMEDMMIEMRRCYTCPDVSERYHLPERFVRRGQVCCVCPEGLWFYRVVVHQIISPAHVEVYYVDFGNMTVVPTANLKFLKSCYSDLPAQAIPSSLAGIKPTTGCWTAEATASFEKLCSHHPLVGVLACYSGDVQPLYLCDTHTEKDIYIHSVLLSEGHGITCSTALCAQVTPVSIYLGKGMIDLPELEEEALSTPNPANILEPSVSHLTMEEELPALELIEHSEVSCRIQDKDTNYFSTLSNDQIVNCSEIDCALNQPHTTHTPSSMSTSAAPPDLIQNKTIPTSKEDLHTMNKTSSTLNNFISSSCFPSAEQEQHLHMVSATSVGQSSPVLKPPDFNIPGLGQGVLFNIRKSGFSFPLFGVR